LWLSGGCSLSAPDVHPAPFAHDREPFIWLGTGHPRTNLQEPASGGVLPHNRLLSWSVNAFHAAVPTRSGASWTEIGKSMGVTKQAARKRFVPKVPGEAAGIDANDGFSRFTPRAKNVVMSAQNEARAAGNDEIGPPHLILGLLSEPDGLASKAIHAQGVVPGTIRRTVAATLPPAAGEVPSLIPLDAQAKKALELTFREALRLGHNYIGTEHILLALLELEDGSGILTGLGLDKTTTETNITDALELLSRPVD
jgi:hypothetical protein